MSQKLESILIMLMALLLPLAGVAFVVLRDNYISRRQRKLLFLIVILAFTLVIENVLEHDLSRHALIPLRLVNSIYGYSVRPIILYLFIEVVDPPKRKWPFWLLILLNALIYSTSWFSDICFTFLPPNSFYRGPLGYCCFYLCGGFLLWNLMKVIILFRDEIRYNGIIIPAFCVCSIVTGTFMDVFFAVTAPISFLTVTVVNSVVLYYIWLHLQYVHAHEDALMAQQRIQIMVSQIQPHFLYNTLSTVQALCRIDPEKASDTLGKFALYLRQNLDSLDRVELIPFEQELEHTHIYVEIEKIRFPQIRVEYKIKETDFNIPALTVQPLVENAIRHGIRIRQKGIVSVETRREGQQILISIRDNGKGFDMAMLNNNMDGHIGIQNVRERVERMCKGTLEIDSVPGRGTLVTIRIPCRAQPDARKSIRK